MAQGYMGKLLFVDLSRGTLQDEELDEKLSRQFIGGYGIGARIVYSRQKANVDPLGPDNMLAFVTGPLTGTPVPFGCKYGVIVGKSPLTDGWGDANSGGDFGPYLKFAGYDGIFFTGVSTEPVYLLVRNGKPEIREASHLWGKDTIETEDALVAELGKGAKVASIGPAGERLNLISSIMNDHGRAAARSGVGAVMGSKRLKAVAVIGDAQVPLADKATVSSLRKECLANLTGLADIWRKFGTISGVATQSHNGDAPVKNWGGVGTRDFPNAKLISDVNVTANMGKRHACYRCPVACSGYMKEGVGEYKYPAGTKRPEWETIVAFGTMCLNDNLDSIMLMNDICNRAGMDTISAGSTVAFAIECYENGLIDNKDTGGLELTWGNHQAILAVTKQMAQREGFGSVLADGSRVAAAKIGKGAEQYAVHVGGQEPGLHDPKFVSPLRDARPHAARFQMDATPGRHMQYFGPSGFYQGHFLNASGLCWFISFLSSNAIETIPRFMSAVTGWDYSKEEMLKAGERIATIRHAVNLREGINPLQLPVHPRIVGKPPLEEGPLAGVTADIEAQAYWNLGAMDWDRTTTKPSKRKLLELDLDDVATDLWPEPTS